MRRLFLSFYFSLIHTSLSRSLSLALSLSLSLSLCVCVCVPFHFSVFVCVCSSVCGGCPVEPGGSGNLICLREAIMARAADGQTSVRKDSPSSPSLSLSLSLSLSAGPSICVCLSLRLYPAFFLSLFLFL